VIIYFPRKGTLDPFLAASLLMFKYPDAKTRELTHYSSSTEENTTEEESILVDIGGAFDPTKKIYDHHHDLSLCFSTGLVLTCEFDTPLPEIHKTPLVKADLIDKHFLPSNPLSVKLYEDLPSDTRLLETYVSFYPPMPEAGEFVMKMLKDKNSDSYHTFLVKLFSVVDKKRESYPNVVESILDYKNRISTLLNSIVTFKLKGLVFGVSNKVVSPFYTEVFLVQKPDVLIEKKTYDTVRFILNPISILAEGYKLSPDRLQIIGSPIYFDPIIRMCEIKLYEPIEDQQDLVTLILSVL